MSFGRSREICYSSDLLRKMVIISTRNYHFLLSDVHQSVHHRHHLLSDRRLLRIRRCLSCLNCYAMERSMRSLRCYEKEPSKMSCSKSCCLRNEEWMSRSSGCCCAVLGQCSPDGKWNAAPDDVPRYCRSCGLWLQYGWCVRWKLR